VAHKKVSHIIIVTEQDIRLGNNILKIYVKTGRRQGKETINQRADHWSHKRHALHYFDSMLFGTTCKLQVSTFLHQHSYGSGKSLACLAAENWAGFTGGKEQYWV